MCKKGQLCGETPPCFVLCVHLQDQLDDDAVPALNSCADENSGDAAEEARSADTGPFFVLVVAPPSHLTVRNSSKLRKRQRCCDRLLLCAVEGGCPDPADLASSPDGLCVLADAKKDAGEAEVTPGTHGACLTLGDHDHIRQFVQEFTFRGLLPHIEKNIRQLNDQVLNAGAQLLCRPRSLLRGSPTR